MTDADRWTEAAKQIRDMLGQEGLDALAEAMRSRYALVSEEQSCPDCYEDRADWLTWDKDGEHVTCASCGRVYTPGEVIA